MTDPNDETQEESQIADEVELKIYRRLNEMWNENEKGK
jgi:hypothetical protein